MEFLINKKSYKIENIQSVETPCLVVFNERVDQNIQTMKKELLNISPNLGINNLCPHVKTHKSEFITKKILNNGITFFKSTMNEVDMLVKAGAEKIFIAYPLTPKHVEKLAALQKNNPNITFFIKVGQPEHIDALKKAGVKWHVYIDINIGMNRTGALSKNVWDLYQKFDESFIFAGLHAYGGHNHSTELNERQEISQNSMDELIKVYQQFSQEGIDVPSIMIGGTPGFISDAEYLIKQNLETMLYLSPGTWIYNDTKTESILPGKFEMAALVLCQVVDNPAPNLYTLNLGHKRWSIDQGPIVTFSVPEITTVSWSEEHTIVQTSRKLDIYDYILIAPKHVCSTVNLWEKFWIIKSNTAVEQLDVSARNR